MSESQSLRSIPSLAKLIPRAGSGSSGGTSSAGRFTSHESLGRGQSVKEEEEEEEERDQEKGRRKGKKTVGEGTDDAGAAAAVVFIDLLHGARGGGDGADFHGGGG
ncbi:hypothetical protein B296_00019812 [Ensete ventricosum]|uniref:Uncharacterized protein n=1 Tax=Ensete ventricosum TaxID=4639 RepID=A0A427B1Y0_ENSVE|nr:hypothetical protein B296_00019812 [Ensete ventricosum]